MAPRVARSLKSGKDTAAEGGYATCIDYHGLALESRQPEGKIRTLAIYQNAGVEIVAWSRVPSLRDSEAALAEPLPFGSGPGRFMC